MHCTTNAKPKLLKDAELGELIAVAYGDDLAIAIAGNIQNSDREERREVAFFNITWTTKPPRAHVVVVDAQQTVLSYGKDWVLDPRISRQADLLSRSARIENAIVLSPDGPLLFCSLPSQFRGDGYFNLTNFSTQHNLPVDPLSLWVRQYRIYASQRDQELGEDPVFELIESPEV